MVMVTHDSSVAARAQRIGQLKHGRLAIPPIATRSPDQGPATGPAEYRRGQVKMICPPAARA